MSGSRSVRTAAGRARQALRERARRTPGANTLDAIQYWDARYRSGGTSGAGSYGRNAAYKAEVINGFIAENHVGSIAEFGCGDGNQLGFYEVSDYLGLDVSESAIDLCRRTFSGDTSKRFSTIKPLEDLDIGQFDLTMSIEVLMHVLDEDDYLWTLDQLFLHSKRYVLIHAPLTVLIDFPIGVHEKYRDLFSYLVPYIGEFAIIDVRLQPGVTPEGRRQGVIGDMSSDFVFLERREKHHLPGAETSVGA